MTTQNTKTENAKTTTTNANRDFFPYAPLAKSDYTDFPIPNGGLTEYNPNGYDPNKHRVLLKTDFQSELLYRQYKSLVHLPWYQRKIQSRIDGHLAEIELIKNPTKSNQIKLEKMVQSVMKQTGQSRADVIALLKNA